jgi:hypothetical protein
MLGLGIFQLLRVQNSARPHLLFLELLGGGETWRDTRTEHAVMDYIERSEEVSTRVRQHLCTQREGSMSCGQKP